MTTPPVPSIKQRKIVRKKEKRFLKDSTVLVALGKQLYPTNIIRAGTLGERKVNSMTSKQYLNQAYRLDQRIQSKLEQVDSLNTLATRATSTLSDMPRNPNRATSKMADVIVKIIDLQNEINKDIDDLVSLKAEIVRAIKSVENKEHQTLLEKRYLCFETWEQIAVDMGYSSRTIYRMHKEATKAIKIKLS